MKLKQYWADKESIEILRNSEVTGNVVILPEQLSREQYQKVNKILIGLGAVWDKKQKAHIAEYDISAELKKVVRTGQYHNWKKDTEYFFTPDTLHEYFDYFNPFDRSSKITVLDPSAGRGHLMRYLKRNLPLAKVHAVEINPLHIPFLQTAGYETIYQGDFMEYQPEMDFDLILMNPPFRESLEHIMQAYTMLKPGGTLLSIVEGGVTFRKSGKYRVWNEFVKDKYLELLELPQGIFAESGTMVQAVILGLTKFDTSVQKYTFYCMGTDDDGVVEISNVPDDIYGITTICVDTASFVKGRRVFPCGSGNDYRLTEDMQEEIWNLITQKQAQTEQYAA